VLDFCAIGHKVISQNSQNTRDIAIKYCNKMQKIMILSFGNKKQSFAIRAKFFLQVVAFEGKHLFVLYEKSAP
jgi:hypothetical protein